MNEFECTGMRNLYLCVKQLYAEGVERVTVVTSENDSQKSIHRIHIEADEQTIIMLKEKYRKLIS